MNFNDIEKLKYGERARYYIEYFICVKIHLITLIVEFLLSVALL